MLYFYLYMGRFRKLINLMNAPHKTTLLVVFFVFCFTGSCLAAPSYLSTTGILQAAGTSSVSYSRFGNTTTNHSNYISAANDLLISGDLSVIGTASFSGPTSISGPFTVTNHSIFGPGTNPRFFPAVVMDAGEKFNDTSVDHVGISTSLSQNTATSGLAAAMRGRMHSSANSGRYSNALAGIDTEVFASASLGNFNADSITATRMVSNARGAGSITNAIGIYNELFKGVGNIRNGIGLYYENVPNANGDTGVKSGTITNQYGLILGDLTRGTSRNVEILLDDGVSGATPTGNFGILQENTHNNAFAGNIGIGTITPTTKLDIKGTASASYLLTGNALQVGNNSSVAYSRFGTATTTHGNYISTANDLLISGDVAIIGTGSFSIASSSKFFSSSLTSCTGNNFLQWASGSFSCTGNGNLTAQSGVAAGEIMFFQSPTVASGSANFTLNNVGHLLMGTATDITGSFEVLSSSSLTNTYVSTGSNASTSISLFANNSAADNQFTLRAGGNSGDGERFEIINGNGVPIFQVASNSQAWVRGGTTPTLTSCGAGSPTVTGNDAGGLITINATIGACTLNFAHTWPATPVCTVTTSSVGGGPVAITTLTTTKMTIGWTSSATNKAYYHCATYSN